MCLIRLKIGGDVWHLADADFPYRMLGSEYGQSS
jgi:hypothetical protein